MLEYEEAVECRVSSWPLALTLLKKIIIKIVSNLSIIYNLFIHNNVIQIKIDPPQHINIFL